MAKINRLEGKGIKARIIDTGNLYARYRSFAESVGYPNAAVNKLTDHTKLHKADSNVGKVLDVLVSSKHPDGRDTLYVLQDDDGEQFIFGEKGIELISPQRTIKEMEYGELIEHIEESIRALRLKAYGEGYEQGKFDQRLDTAFGEVSSITNGDIPRKKTAREFLKESKSETAQEKRDQIVERAKKDIKELMVVEEYEYIFETKGVNSEYIINRDKRTVVCLLSGYIMPEIYARGIAKCAPNDCFNVHIGKAIALRRALGLEIPDEYLNTPQPTEVRVGDVVEFDTPIGDRRRKIVEQITEYRYNFTSGTWLEKDAEKRYGNGYYEVRIVDDSRDEVSE